MLNDEGKLEGLNTVRVEWTKDSGGRWKMEEVPGSSKFFPAQLVFLALGFLGPQNEVIQALGVKQDARSNIQTPHKKYTTSVEGVFAAGDCRRGQSLIVWGINEGRGAAAEVDSWLMAGTRLPSAGGIKTRVSTLLYSLIITEFDELRSLCRHLLLHQANSHKLSGSQLKWRSPRLSRSVTTMYRREERALR